MYVVVTATVPDEVTALELRKMAVRLDSYGAKVRYAGLMWTDSGTCTVMLFTDETLRTNDHTFLLTVAHVPTLALALANADAQAYKQTA